MAAHPEHAAVAIHKWRVHALECNISACAAVNSRGRGKDGRALKCLVAEQVAHADRFGREARAALLVDKHKVVCVRHSDPRVTGNGAAQADIDREQKGKEHKANPLEWCFLIHLEWRVLVRPLCRLERARRCSPRSLAWACTGC